MSKHAKQYPQTFYMTDRACWSGESPISPIKYADFMKGGVAKDNLSIN